MTTFAGSRPTTVIRATPTRFATTLLSIAVSSTFVGIVRGQQVTGSATLLPKPSAAVPATPPTALPAPQTAEATPPPAQHLDVEFAEGKVSIEASNANLNQVLHEVATKAGFKITGSVSDERVFGHYGPSTPAVVLAMLLDGTGANMLLVDDAKGASELILTPRRGSPSPPNANASQEITPYESTPAARYSPPIRPFQPPYQGRPQGGLGPGPQAQPETNQGSDPNSAKQIYDQLQRNAQQAPASDDANQPQTPPQ